MSSSDANLTLGEFLRQERERRGITIEQVASATKIGIKTLHSLEADQFAELPAKPFVRGFVTSYARFVGLDPKEILTQFGDFIDSKAHDRPNREGGHSGYAFEKREGDQSRTVLWVVMGSFVVLGGVAAIFVKKPLGHHHGSHADKLRAAYGVAPSPSAQPSGVPSPLASVAAPSAAPSAEATPVSTPVASATPTSTPAPTPTSTPAPVPSATVAMAAPVPVPAPEPTPASTSAEEGPNPEDPLNSGLKLKPSEIKYKVVFKAVESAWVRYKVDHKPITQFVFRTGKTLVLRAREAIRFQVSPPKAVTFSYKGSGFKPVLGDQHLVTRQNDATMFFPYEIADSIQEPFAGEKPLSNRSVPPPRPSPSLSTPSP
jgi:cytoskeleton protein RodZ